VERQEGISHERAKIAIVEYSRFLTLKKILKDYSDDKISPSPMIDRIWIVHIADTKK